jgi:hypothetical protein
VITRRFHTPPSPPNHSGTNHQPLPNPFHHGYPKPNFGISHDPSNSHIASSSIRPPPQPHQTDTMASRPGINQLRIGGELSCLLASLYWTWYRSPFLELGARARRTRIHRFTSLPRLPRLATSIQIVSRPHRLASPRIAHAY